MTDTGADNELSKPRRRWFQFRLRTLLVGVVLIGAVCGYVAHEWRIVAARHEFLIDRSQDCRLEIWKKDAIGRPNLPWLRLLMGDEAVGQIGLPLTTTAAERRRIAALFPEAQILALPAHAPNPILVKNRDGSIGLIVAPLKPFPDDTPSQAQH